MAIMISIQFFLMNLVLENFLPEFFSNGRFSDTSCAFNKQCLPSISRLFPVLHSFVYFSFYFHRHNSFQQYADYLFSARATGCKVNIPQIINDTQGIC